MNQNTSDIATPTLNSMPSGENHLIDNIAQDNAAVQKYDHNNHKTEAHPEKLTIMNLKDACNYIAAAGTECDFHAVFPLQITDGNIISFVTNDGKIIAEGRLRLINKISIDQNTGNMSLNVFISDITMSRASVRYTSNGAPKK